MDFAQIPEWLGSAIFGAILAIVGYVGTKVLEWFGALRDDERRRRGRLAELLALIRVGDIAWKVQSEHRNRLTELLIERLPGRFNPAEGYDRIFTFAYSTMTSEEREIFDVIRAMTMHTFRPLNESLIHWIRADTEFRVRPSDETTRGKLAEHLNELEAHLLLWGAKYQVWIPDHPERALVYLADERRHGLGFPTDGFEIVEAVLSSSSWIRA